MEFKEFAGRLKTIIGGKDNTVKFTRTLFLTMMNEDGEELLKDTKDNTMKSYFNGQTKITRIASLILAHLNDGFEFAEFLNSFGESTIQLIADAFSDIVPDINTSNAAEKLEELFLDILKSAAEKKKSTPKSAKNKNGNSPSMAAEEQKLYLPEEHSSDDIPYSDDDLLLLKEFTDDYDTIMATIIGENYAVALIDMKLPKTIQDLYLSKWNIKANNFENPTLKGQVFELLGVLNKISDNFLATASPTPIFRQSRTKIRNLYVKLHPELFTISFPYDVFIDDWNEGEF